MRLKWSIILSGVAMVCALCWPAEARTVEKQMRTILLTSPRPRQGPNKFKMMQRLQEENGLSDRQIGDILEDFIRNGIQEDEDRVGLLAENAISMIVRYPTGDTKDLLESLIIDKDPAMSGAIRSYMRMNDHKVSGVIKKVLNQSDKYNYLERFKVYDVLESAYDEAREKNDRDKQRRIIETVSGIIENETDISNFTYMDEFLVAWKAGYETSDMRRKLLWRHSRKDDHKLTSAKLEEYIDRELEEMKHAKLEKTPPAGTGKDDQKPTTVENDKKIDIEPEDMTPEKLKRISVGDVELELAYVKAGRFKMGSERKYEPVHTLSPLGKRKPYADERPVHTVRITKPFWMGRYEVTRAQYEELMDETPSKFDGDSNPVRKVTWNNAMDFCKKLTEREHKAGRLPAGCEYRLPTEAEWEYAARGGHKNSRDYQYAGSDDIDNVAWYYKNSEGKTHAAGRLDPNELGLYDMSGNVKEWCIDWYDDEYYERAKVVQDPVNNAKTKYRVTRGGSCASYAKGCHVADRHHSKPTSDGVYLGFRIVLAPSLDE